MGLLDHKGPLDHKAPENNFDLDSKKILNLEVLNDNKTDDPYEYRVKNLKNAVSKECLNEDFWEKKTRS